MSVQMLPELRRYIQHISLSPDSINNDDVSPRSGSLNAAFILVSVVSAAPVPVVVLTV